MRPATQLNVLNRCVRRVALLAGVLMVLAAGGLRAEELTTPQLMDKFARSGAADRIAVLKKIYQPDPKDDVKRYKVPDFLCAVLKNDAEDPRVRQETLTGMVQLVVKDDTAYRSQFIPAMIEVLNSDNSTLVQEYILLASPAMVDATGPGPNKVLQDKIVAMAKNNKLTDDREIRMRMQAVIALGKIGNETHLQLFFDLMSDPNKGIVSAAIEAVNQYLRTKSKNLDLSQPQITRLIALLNNPDTSFESRAAILLALGIYARNFRASHPANQIAPGTNEGMAEIKRLLNMKTTEPLPYFLVGACIEALGLFAQKDAVPIIRSLLALPYMKTPDAMAYRKNSVDVLDQVIVANIGDGKAYSQVVEDSADLLVELMADAKEDPQVRQAAAFYLADVRFAVYHREEYFEQLFFLAYPQPPAAGGQPAQLDTALSAVCKKSMEVLAERTFPDDWTFQDVIDWWNQAGKKLLTCSRGMRKK